MSNSWDLDRLLRPWLPVALWIGVIAWLGSGDFQAAETSRIIGPLLHWLFPDWEPQRIAALHGAIRKLAHPSIYAVAAVLAFRAWGLTLPQAARVRQAALALALVAVVAAADESRQATLPGRTGSVRDVGLDLLGGSLGLAVAPWLLRRLREPHPDAGVAAGGARRG